MNKIISLVLVVVFLSTGLVIAQGFKLANYPQDFPKGWNLITLDYMDPLLEHEVISHIYIFDPVTQKYIGGHVHDTTVGVIMDENNSNVSNEMERAIMDIVERNKNDYLGFSFFVYLERDVKGVRGKKIDGGLECAISSLSLQKGWNFIAYIQEFKGKRFSDFKGTCTIQRAYAFCNSSKIWAEGDFLQADEIFDGGNDLIGLGIIVKVAQNCKFDFRGQLPTVPTLPTVNRD